MTDILIIGFYALSATSIMPRFGAASLEMTSGVPAQISNVIQPTPALKTETQVQCESL